MTHEITMKSSLKEVYAHPVGHDALKKILLQSGLPDHILTNPISGSLSLRAVAKLTGKILDAEFWDTFLELLNSEWDTPEEAPLDEIQRTWWKEAVFYQIYPRSFADSDGDGIGDLNGIIRKLDYLKNLGVDALWLSPVYDSPNDDNGYDIRDYHKIMDEFGTMEDFDRLLFEVHKRGMQLIMDLVVNHTSDEHPWFQKAVKDPDSPYHDYYLFAKSKNGKEPNNWISFFGQGKAGDAWTYLPKNDEWALHLFSKKQMDLNWDNARLRSEIISMVNWWLEKGVDGFRMDVINYISKAEGLPDGNESVGKLIGYTGIEHYFYGPHLHEYLRELQTKCFRRFDAFSVGETPGIGMQMAKLLTDESRQELDMVFSFDHLETPGHTRFDDYRYDLNYLKSYYIEWTRNYTNRCWMSLFYENHDNPRMISKVDPDPKFRAFIGKLLGMIQLTLKGTPFIYQGQETGAINADFQDISQLQDVESLNLYEEFCETMDEAQAFQKILAGTRDHARVMINWEETDAQERDKDSVYHFYKKLIRIRKNHPALVYGDVDFLHVHRKDLFTWIRALGKDRWYVECNLSSRRIRRPKRPKGFRGVLSNRKMPEKHWMQPYEACLYIALSRI
ncbi:MAG: alpha-glucosidase [Ruminococcus sp.]|nr:alpha-glucosidase [Ruminococcus sp.]